MNLTNTWIGDKPYTPPPGLFGQGRRILIAEDDEDMRVLLATTLRHDGFVVTEARNGMELLDQIAPWLEGKEPPEPIDVIVSDVQMPSFTGLEILAGLSEVRRRPAVILITGFGDPPTRAAAESLGAAAFFDKPFDIDELRGALFSLQRSA
jgi:two-component system response regulator (stage 0 sporulation protein F)